MRIPTARPRASLLALAVLSTVAAVWAQPTSFDGQWAGTARDVHGAKGCADQASVQLTISGATARGTMRLSSATRESFTWDLAADGTIRTPGVSGRFIADTFQGRWTRPGSRGPCLYEVDLSRGRSR